MSELPEGWVTEKLGAISIKIGSGATPKGGSETYHAAGIPLIRSMNVHFDGFKYEGLAFLDEIQAEKLKNVEVAKDDVLLNITGASIGRVTLAPPVMEGARVNQHVAIIRLLDEINPNYIRYFLASPEQQSLIAETESGVTRQALTKGKIEDFIIPLAPLAEQKRIADKLDALLARVDGCRARLARVPAILKRFRQAVLAAATSGALTADWREENPDIKAEFFASHVVVVDDGPLDLPINWSWVYLESLCDQIVDCPHSTPKWAESGRICVRTTNFKPGYLDLSEINYVTEETYQERIKRLTPKLGDILYSREGGILGIACMIPPSVDLCLGQRMMLMRTSKNYLPGLLMYWLNSPEILSQVRSLTGGTASPHLNVKDIKSFPTPLPPLEEQHEIVRRVETLFGYADRLEARYTAALTRVERLTPALLAKAFRGELVAQDSADEPAALLLERVQAARGAMGESRVRRRPGID